MEIRRLVPLLHVERIEDSLPFWCERLGFEPTMQVRDPDGLGFVLLVRDGVQIMLQSEANVRRETPQLAKHPAPGAGLLYLEVDALDEWVAMVDPDSVLVPTRRTSYGAREVALRDPAGYTVVLSEFA